MKASTIGVLGMGAAGAIASLALGFQLHRHEGANVQRWVAEDRAREARMFGEALRRLEDRLHSTRVMFRQSEQVDADEFLLLSLSMMEGLPGLVAWLWAPSVVPDGMAAHEQSGRRWHGPGYAVRGPERPSGASRSPVLYLYPEANQRERLGEDLAGTPGRRAMLEAATASGKPACSGPFPSAEAASGSVYALALPSQTGGNAGHVVVEFDLLTMFAEVARSLPPRGLHLALFDPEWSTVAPVALHECVDDGDAHGEFTAAAAGGRDVVRIGDRELWLCGEATGAYLADRESAMPFVVAAIGLFLTAGAMWGLHRRGRAAALVAEKVEQRTRELADANRRLEASEARARAIFEVGLVGLAELGRDTAVVGCNEDFARLLARSRTTLPGTKLVDLVAPEAAPPLAAALARLVVDGGRHTGLLTMVRGDGAPLPVSLGVAAAHGEDREVERLLLVLVDMTEVSRLVDSLRDAKDLAEAANRSKSAFLANMSHEIRTPMTAILGYTELLHEADLGGEAARAVEVIERNGRHLLVILNDILDLSKVEAGRMRVETVRAPLVPLLDDVVGLMQARAEAKGLALSLEATSPVPVYVATDPTRLRQILVNLVGNAIKFTERGSVRIAVSCTPPGELPARLRILVEDTGPGMSVAQQAELFQPFAQGDTSMSRRFGGTGLGLVISQRFATMLGGAIQVASEPGRGTTFRLQIDVGSLAEADLAPTFAAARERVAKKSAARPESPASMPAVGGGRLLVAEDGPDNQRLLRAMLQKAGYEVEIVADGRQAIDAVRAADAAGRPFDLLVMDMQMPVLDGYTAVRTLRDGGCATPVLACTAHAMAEDRERCLAAGCNDYTQKPIDRRELLRKVAERLAAARVTSPGP